jgi:hypothetical protein
LGSLDDDVDILRAYESVKSMGYNELKQHKPFAVISESKPKEWTKSKQGKIGY